MQKANQSTCKSERGPQYDAMILSCIVKQSARRRGGGECGSRAFATFQARLLRVISTACTRISQAIRINPVPC